MMGRMHPIRPVMDKINPRITLAMVTVLSKWQNSHVRIKLVRFAHNWNVGIMGDLVLLSPREGPQNYMYPVQFISSVFLLS